VQPPSPAPTTPTFATPGLPARAALDADGLHVALIDIPTSELRDPFLQETVQRVSAAQALYQVPKGDLGRVPADTAPAGLIFHVARCGSTLASQLLKQSDGLAVYSEPLAINEVLVPPHKASRAELVGALRSLGALFAAHARGPYVLKLTSWNTLFCDIVAEAFPQSPWALCLRDPLEVCVSLQRQRPGWLRGDFGATFTSLADPDSRARSDEDQLALVYAGFCEAIGRLDQARGLIVPYEALPGAVWLRLAPHFGLRVDEISKQRMADTSRTHAKSPVGRATPFVPDDTLKRAAATPGLMQSVDTLARPAYQRLIQHLPR
jgi:hypothetical protein